MRFVDLESNEISEYESHGVTIIEALRHSEVLQEGDQANECRVHLAHFVKGATIGRHPTRLWQLFQVVSGSGWVSGSDGERVAIQANQSVVWSPGEEHESGTDGEMTVLIVQTTAEIASNRPNLQ